MTTRQRKFWGWGFEGAGPDAKQEQGIAQLAAARFGLRELRLSPPPRINDVALRTPRVCAPEALAEICSDSRLDRAGHTYGKSFRDVVRGLRGDFASAPDFVARPRHEDDLVRLLEWCAAHGVAAVPYGGGSSVVGGVEMPSSDVCRGAISVDLERFDRILEVDRTSRAARIQGGILGPALEDGLRPHGLTLRHFPQSFELSSLGGWIATRSGGHFATLHTHIDDFVESLRVVTPSGTIESRRLPGSGAGPSPDRMFIGCEGTLGIITEAWMRLQDRPRFRASASVTFTDLESGARAARALAQCGLHPSNCRLLDPGEALTAGAGDGTHAVLLVAFESADHPLDPWMNRALELCRDHGGRAPADAGRTRTDSDAGRSDAAGAWRKSFLQAPYMRDVLVRMGLIVETFETAVTWDRFDSFHAAVIAATRDALQRICGGGMVNCRFTHLYPDGPAPYYSVIAPAAPNSDPLGQWAEIKQAAAEAILAHGGTITHHHAVGRDHRPWYDRQRPGGFARAFAAVKRELDPAGILNPGVLIDSKSLPPRSTP